LCPQYFEPFLAILRMPWFYCSRPLESLPFRIAAPNHWPFSTEIQNFFGFFGMLHQQA
jgi:hypothetical protein